jgi:hypothetical protein
MNKEDAGVSQRGSHENGGAQLRARPPQCFSPKQGIQTTLTPFAEQLDARANAVRTRERSSTERSPAE